MSLKQKTVSGLLWSFVDSIGGQGISFIFGIVLARMLSPAEFGLIGMLAIFIAVSQSFIDSGFSQALIRKQDCSETDYSTVFYFNIAIGIIAYFLLFISASAIGRFFHEPVLKDLIRILGLGIVINSFTIIHSTLIAKRIDFRLQAKISIIASLFSGILSISFAYNGWGVWSLVVLMISKYLINGVLLWIWNKWVPRWQFSINSFVELFSFGSKLLLSGLIDTIYRNVYYLVIGKYFSAQELGYYARADQFQSMPSTSLQVVISRVSYPVLAIIQHDIPRLREAYKKIVRSTMFVTFVLMLGMAAIAKPMILTLIGEKWEPSIVYLQLLCFVGMFYPLHALNLSILQVTGRTDLFLKLEIIKKALAIPVIFIGVFYGILEMLFGMIGLTLIAYYLNSYWSGHLIGYSFFEQVKNILPSFLLALLMSVIVFLEGLMFTLQPLPLLIIQVVSGAVIILGLSEAIRFKDYLYIKEIVIDKFDNWRYR